MAEKTSLPRPSNSPVLIAVVVMALAGLVGLNTMANQARPKSDHEIEAEAKERSSAAATPTPAAPPSAPAGASSPLTPGDPNALVLAGQGSTLGSPEAKQEVIVGFSFTPEVQSDPAKVTTAVEALQKAVGSQARVKVVNVDESPGVPEGISIGGKVIVPAKSDGAIDPSGVGPVMQALSPAP